MIEWDDAMWQLIATRPENGEAAGDIEGLAYALGMTPDAVSDQMLAEVLAYLQGDSDAS